MSDLASQLDALLHGCGVATLADRAFLHITGSDAIRWLNGMVTNSIQALEPGQGSYNFLLNAQGRIQGDCNIFRDTDGQAFTLETDASQVETIASLLDRFIIMDDVELSRGLLIGGTLCDQPAGLLLAGPSALQCVRRLLAETEGDTPELTSGTRSDLSLHGAPAAVLVQPGAGIAVVEIWFANGQQAASVSDRLREVATEVSTEALEVLRIVDGRPRYGKDIRERDLPQETNQTHALHFAKGCYLGQEIVERIRSRGQVHRIFTRLELTGKLPPDLPAALEANGKAAGEITSAALVPLADGEKLLALGYVRREALDLKQPLTYSAGSAEPRS